MKSASILFHSIRLLLSENLHSGCGSVEFIESRSTLMVSAKFLAMDVEWPILLERLESTVDMKCDFLVKELGALKSSIDQLVASNKELSDSVKYLKQTLGLPEKVQRPLFAAINNTNYTLSADRKTLVKNANTGNEWQGFVSEQSLLAIGNRFTLNLTIEDSALMVGVARRGTDPTDGLYSKAGSWMLYIVNGSIYSFYNNGNEVTAANKATGANGGKLSVSVDPATMQLVFELNGAAVHNVAPSELSFNLFPAVDLFEAYQSVTFD